MRPDGVTRETCPCCGRVIWFSNLGVRIGTNDPVFVFHYTQYPTVGTPVECKGSQKTVREALAAKEQ